MKLGTIIRATSHDCRTIIAGRYVDDVLNAYGNKDMVIEQSNGLMGYVRKELFTIEEIRMSSFELEMRELIALYLKKGFSPEYILLNAKKAIDNLRDPETEIKGDMDT